MKKTLIFLFVFLLCFSSLTVGASANAGTSGDVLTEKEINKVLAEEGMKKVEVTKKDEKNLEKFRKERSIYK